MLFASLVLEKEPMRWAELPAALMAWLQNAGGIAAMGIAIILLVRWVIALSGAKTHEGAIPFKGSAYTCFVTGLGLSVVAYVVFFILWLVQLLAPGSIHPGLRQVVLTVAGGAMLLAVVSPVLTDLLGRLSCRRIWALARLSIREAIRRYKVGYVFLAMAPIFLFAGWFLPEAPADQVRNHVLVVFRALAFIFVVTGSLLGALSIPADVKNQSIHTIVTKPVERFEIVLGRFFGYALLLTIGLFGLSALSLVFLDRGISVEAAQESYKARVPLFGQLKFHGTKKDAKGEYEGDNVGREWSYRKYISGRDPRMPNLPQQYAFWQFDSVPAYLGTQEKPTHFEFTFDIFRLTKGEENRGVFCTFLFVDGRLEVEAVEAALKKQRQERDRLKAEARKKLDSEQTQARTAEARQQAVDHYQERLQEIEAELIRTHAVYESAGLEVTDYHTQSLEVPAVLFARLTELEEQQPRQMAADGKMVPFLKAMVSVDRSSFQQMLGMAPRDFYLLAAERPFAFNFFKGIAGLWIIVILVLGVAVACSTYLSGVISWLCTIFLILFGLFTDFIQQVAEGKAIGGGPLEAATRLYYRTPLAAPLDDTPTTAVVRQLDEAFRWWLRRFLNIIPDVSRFDLLEYVGNGFDIPWGQVLLLDNFLPLLGYLIPWAIAGYYLMKYREVANPT